MQRRLGKEDLRSVIQNVYINLFTIRIMGNYDSKKIEKLVKRIVRLENIVLNKKTDKLFQKNKKYLGLAGGIQLLIDNKFLNKPRGVPEIVSELKRETYSYPMESVRAELSRDFTKKKKNSY